MSNPVEPLLINRQSVIAPESLRRSAFLDDFQAEYERSRHDPERFWADWARRFDWQTPWSRVLEWNAPEHRWFAGAKTNITHNALDRHADGPRRDRTALIWIAENGSDRKVTYGELRELVARCAAGLRELGVGIGDRVVIYMPLTLEGVVSMLACARLGAVHSVVYAGLGVAALRERIEDAGARVVMAGDVGYRRGKAIDLRAIVREACRDLALDRIVWFRRESDGPLGPGEADFLDLIERHEPDVAPEWVDAEHPLFILYTSGSTGKPRGVVHVHGGYMVGTTYHLRSFFDVRDDDVYWATSDIGWIVGHSYIVYAPLVEGVTSVFREGAPDYPDPGAIWSVVARHRVNVMFTAPTAVRMFMKFGAEWPARHDLSSLRLVTVAGEPLNPEAWSWAYEHLAGSGARGFVVDNWWQTELGGPTIGTPVTLPVKPGAAGVALPGVDAAVVDSDGTELPPGKGGLLVLRNPFPHMMRTVWGQHERYLDYWRKVPGGVYTAGDIATRDADGYFTVLGRSDDVLNVAGHRIGTADVESALVSHPAVAEAAVIGLPDPLKGEAIKAFVVLRSGREPGDSLRDDLLTHVRHELGPIATPGALEFAEKLPKTRSGKILRRVLKARELGQDPGDVSTIEE